MHVENEPENEMINIFPLGDSEGVEYDTYDDPGKIIAYFIIKI